MLVKVAFLYVCALECSAASSASRRIPQRRTTGRKLKQKHGEARLSVYWGFKEYTSHTRFVQFFPKRSGFFGIV
jgi:hypothetical protein